MNDEERRARYAAARRTRAENAAKRREREKREYERQEPLVRLVRDVALFRGLLSFEKDVSAPLADTLTTYFCWRLLADFVLTDPPAQTPEVPS